MGTKEPRKISIIRQLASLHFNLRILKYKSRQTYVTVLGDFFYTLLYGNCFCFQPTGLAFLHQFYFFDSSVLNRLCIEFRLKMWITKSIILDFVLISCCLTLESAEEEPRWLSIGGDLLPLDEISLSAVSNR